MDDSKQYFEMCGKAEEIQKGHKWQAWDYCHCEITKKVVVVSGYETDAGCYGHEIPSYLFEDRGIIGTWVEHGGCGGEGKHIWLPTQAQLQEMVCKSVDDIMWMPTLFYWGAQDWYNVTEYVSKFQTAEQLWLGYVMHKKWQKVWDGNDWIKETA